jgi:hypothetical protein
MISKMPSGRSVLTKKTSDGRQALVTRRFGSWHVTIDGREFTSGQLRRLERPEGSATHVIGEGHALTLSADEAAVLEEAEGREAAFRASPMGQRRELVRVRDAAMQAWILALEYAKEGRGDFGVEVKAEAMEAAQAAVLEFDAKFPRVRDEDEIISESDIRNVIRRYRNEW